MANRNNTKQENSGKGEFINAFQRKAADFINERTATWTLKYGKVCLIIFCLFTGSVSLVMIIKGFMPANGPPVVSRTQLSVPKLIPDSVKIYQPFKNKQNDNNSK